jgi:hypothetical protein
VGLQRFARINYRYDLENEIQRACEYVQLMAGGNGKRLFVF